MSKRRTGEYRSRFQVRHLGKLQLLRRIVGNVRENELTPAQRKFAGELLDALNSAIAEHEKRRGLRLE